MNEKETRELDVQVHRALYPESEIAPWLDFGPGLSCVGSFLYRLPSSREWSVVPSYSTDIGAWDVVYKLRPWWMWDTREMYGHVDTALFYDVMREDPLPFIEVSVPWDETRGLAAYALGRARCVIEWTRLGEK